MKKKRVSALLLSIVMIEVMVLRNPDYCAKAASGYENTTVTIHFRNAGKWDNVGVWAYEGMGFKRQVMPADLCPAYNTKTDRAIWPGAKMEKELDHEGWYSIRLTFKDTSSGAVFIFNNLVADTKADTSTGGDETDQEFLDGAKKKGLICDTELKKYTHNQYIAKNFTAGDYWCDFDGNIYGSATLLSKSMPKSYGTVEKELQYISVNTKSIKPGTKGILLGAKTSGDGRLAYKSGNKSVITIDSNGVMNAKKPGKSVITVTASETTKYKKATRQVTITVLPKEKQVISVKSVSKIYTGKSSLDIKAKAKGDVKLKYSVDNKKIASVDNKGLVKLKGCGNLKITVTAPETAMYKSAKKVINITVKPQKINKIVTGSSGKGWINVSWSKDDRATSYNVVLSKDSGFKNTKTVQTVKTDLNAGNMPSMYYYVKIQAVYKVQTNDKSIEYCGEWSKVKKVKVK